MLSEFYPFDHILGRNPKNFEIVEHFHLFLMLSKIPQNILLGDSKLFEFSSFFSFFVQILGKI